MGKRFSWALGCWLLAVVSVLCAGCSHRQHSRTESPSDTLQLLTTHIQQCSRLYTAEYAIHKVVTHDDVLRLRGQLTGEKYDFELPFLGDRKIAIPMDATVKAYIDFSGFSEANVERNGQHITIILPDPKVLITSTKIDHQNIRKYVALLRHDFTDDELSSYEQQGRAAIAAAIPDMGIVESARKNAAHILIPIIQQMGFSEQDITITFRQDLDIASTIERTTE